MIITYEIIAKIGDTEISRSTTDAERLRDIIVRYYERNGAEVTIHGESNAE